MESSKPQAGDESADYYKVYEEYAKNLRTWFVAYGVGAPVLFVSNKDIAEKLASSHAAPSIAAFFLLKILFAPTSMERASCLRRLVSKV